MKYEKCKIQMLKEIESIEFYLKLTSKCVNGEFNKKCNEIIDVCEIEKTNLSNALGIIEGSVKKMHKFEIDENTDIQDLMGSDTLQRVSDILDNMNNKTEYLKESFVENFCKPQEGIIFQKIRNNSVFILLCSLYEELMSIGENHKMVHYINYYCEMNAGDNNWREWSDEAHKIRKLRNKVVHLDEKVNITDNQIKSTIENIKKHIELKDAMF